MPQQNKLYDKNWEEWEGKAKGLFLTTLPLAAPFRTLPHMERVAVFNLKVHNGSPNYYLQYSMCMVCLLSILVALVKDELAPFVNPTLKTILSLFKNTTSHNPARIHTNTLHT